jgi:hypothetical protein
MQHLVHTPLVLQLYIEIMFFFVILSWSPLMWLLSSWDGERENRYKCVQRTRFLMTNIKGVCTRYPLLTTVSLARSYTLSGFFSKTH